MAGWILLLVFAAGVIFYMIRYYSLIAAIKQIRRELDDACQDLTQNQMLHLPLPSSPLAELLCSVNAALEGIQKERQHYERREKEFQSQIENISHDLRTPLTVILGYLRLFRKSGMFLSDDAAKDPRAQKQELLETITILEQKAEVMNHLVSQFYDYSRFNSGSYEIELQRIDASRILRESLMGSYQILQQNELEVDVRLIDHAVWVLGDTAALERIFLNLFQNAARYADTWLRIAMEEHETEISIFFENDSRTLDREDVPYIFERFYIQDHSRSHGGTGLGLTVAKSLAEKMEGMLTARLIDPAASSSSDEALAAYTKSGMDNTPAAFGTEAGQGADSDMDCGGRLVISFELKLKVLQGCDLFRL